MAGKTGLTKNRGKVAQTVFDLARPVAEGLGLTLWDVDFFKEGGAYDLLVTVDRPEGGVSLDDCEALSRALSLLLDERDPIEESYCLEVSSAGLERKLIRPEHFEAYVGKAVTARLYAPKNGQKSFTGTLLSRKDGQITLQTPDGETRFAESDVADCRAADADF